MEEKELRAICLLKNCWVKLGRLPVKGDFQDTEVSFIKSVLGPWPRALERAGLKPGNEKKKKASPHPRKRRQADLRKETGTNQKKKGAEK